jgi:hypothetical protein
MISNSLTHSDLPARDDVEEFKLESRPASSERPLSFGGREESRFSVLPLKGRKRRAILGLIGGSLQFMKRGALKILKRQGK